MNGEDFAVHHQWPMSAKMQSKSDTRYHRHLIARRSRVYGPWYDEMRPALRRLIKQDPDSTFLPKGTMQPAAAVSIHNIQMLCKLWSQWSLKTTVKACI